MFGNKDKKLAEKELATWLSHPNEFGTPPKSVKHKRKYKLNFMGEPTDVHLLTYTMPDGTTGRGFVNPITWSFLGDGVNEIPDDQIIQAYAGWVFTFTGMQNGSILTQFESEGEEQAYLQDLTNNGLSNIVITAKYKIGTSELFEFTAEHAGSPVKGAGSTDVEVGFSAQDARYNLPAIYTLLGQQVLN